MFDGCDDGDGDAGDDGNGDGDAGDDGLSFEALHASTLNGDRLACQGSLDRRYACLDASTHDYEESDGIQIQLSNWNKLKPDLYVYLLLLFLLKPTLGV